jgi:hypothetical protein
MISSIKTIANRHIFRKIRLRQITGADRIAPPRGILPETASICDCPGVDFIHIRRMSGAIRDYGKFPPPVNGIRQYSRPIADEVSAKDGTGCPGPQQARLRSGGLPWMSPARIRALRNNRRNDNKDRADVRIVRCIGA